MKKILSLFCLLFLSYIIQAQEQDWFADFNMCEDKDTIIAFPSNVTLDSSVTFQWVFNNTAIEANSDNSITVNAGGLYTLIVVGDEIDKTESFTVTLDLFVYDYFIFLNGEQSIDSDTLCLEDEPTLNSNYPEFTHYWYLNGEALDDTLSESSLVIEDILEEIDFNQEYIYTLSLENECGVYSNSSEVKLTVNECYCALNMPNVFTPNGDDFNNTFKPFNDHEDQSEAENMCESTDFTMEVYSQWGRHTATINSGNEYPSWDGLNKRGREVPEGVYFYRIVYKVNIYTKPTEKEITGFVHLYRD
jgi:gliding motility-associated-like protein